MTTSDGTLGMGMSHWWIRRVADPVLLLTICGTLSSTASVAQETEQQADIDLASQVPVWVAQLDAATAQQRRAAEQALVKAGAAAEPFVPVVVDHLSVDARLRLKRIRQQWRQVRTRAEVETTVVRMQSSQTLGEALEAISLASGVEFDLESGGGGIDPTRSITPPKTPLGFWQAIDNVLDQTELDINFYAGDRETLALVPRPEHRPSRADSAAYAGIYRLEPTIVTARRVLDAPLQSGLNITISIAWQPNRTPIGLSLPVNELNGKLDNGLALQPQASGDAIEVATSSEIAESTFYLPMKLPDRKLPFDEAGKLISPAREIQRVGGVLFALLPGSRETFELDLGQAAASQRHDAMTVTIESVRKNGELHEVRVSVMLEDAGRSLESHRQWVFENDVFIRMSDGTRKDHLGYEVFRQTNDGVGIGYLFDLGGDTMPPLGTQLIYESPTSVIENRVPFLINAIPMP